MEIAKILLPAALSIITSLVIFAAGYGALKERITNLTTKCRDIEKQLAYKLDKDAIEEIRRSFEQGLQSINTRIDDLFRHLNR